MGTEIAWLEGQYKNGSFADMFLTRFWGGSERKSCIQFTISGNRNYIQLTNDELLKLKIVIENHLANESE
jgi:hypothetical protein